MEFYFWRAPNGKTPVKEFITEELDDENAGKLWQRLEFFQKLPASSMWREEHLSKYDRELIYLRIILKGILCRIFCDVQGEKCILFHVFIKKGRKIHPRDASIAKKKIAIYKQQTNLR